MKKFKALLTMAVMLVSAGFVFTSCSDDKEDEGTVQIGRSTLNIDWDDLSASNAITVTTNPEGLNWSADVIEGSSWLQVNRGNGSFTVQATSENTGESSRIARVVVSVRGDSKTLTVTQAADVAEIILSARVVPFTNAELNKTVEVEVDAPGEWTITDNNKPTWVNVVKGSDNKTLAVTMTELNNQNTTLTATYTISVEDQNVSDATLTVTLQGEEFYVWYTVQDDEYTSNRFYASPGAQSFKVKFQTNIPAGNDRLIEWKRAEDSDEWITAASNAAGEFTVTLKANPDEDLRASVLYIKLRDMEDSEIKWAFWIFQYGTANSRTYEQWQGRYDVEGAPVGISQQGITGPEEWVTEIVESYEYVDDDGITHTGSGQEDNMLFFSSWPMNSQAGGFNVWHNAYIPMRYFPETGTLAFINIGDTTADEIDGVLSFDLDEDTNTFYYSGYSGMIMGHYNPEEERFVFNEPGNDLNNLSRIYGYGIVDLQTGALTGGYSEFYAAIYLTPADGSRAAAPTAEYNPTKRSKHRAAINSTGFNIPAKQNSQKYVTSSASL